MRPVRIVLEREDFANLVRGEVVRCRQGTRVMEVLLREMPLLQIVAITNGDPRAKLSQFGNQDPVLMSPADLRANSGYLQASGALSDSQAYAEAADLLERVGGPGPALKLELVAEQIFQEMDRNLREGDDGQNEKLSTWRSILLQVIEALP